VSSRQTETTILKGKERDSMKKAGVIGMAVVFMVSFTALSLYAGDEAVNAAGSPTVSVPKILVLDSLSKLYDPVKFDHGMHSSMTESCTECHHKDTAGSATPCRNCHSTFDPAMDSQPGLKGAYHRKCFQCHEIKAGSDPATGCTEKCHAKKQG